MTRLLRALAIIVAFPFLCIAFVSVGLALLILPDEPPPPQ